MAQIHTHTDKVDPRPAKKDVSFAKRIGIPIYTVSVSGIWIAKPDGVVKQLSGVGWYKAVRKQ